MFVCLFPHWFWKCFRFIILQGSRSSPSYQPWYLGMVLVLDIPGDQDNDFCPGWLKSDFTRGVIFGQYPSERLVQFSLEDAIRDLLDTGTAILPPGAILRNSPVLLLNDLRSEDWSSCRIAHALVAETAKKFCWWELWFWEALGKPGMGDVLVPACQVTPSLCSWRPARKRVFYECPGYREALKTALEHPGPLPDDGLGTALVEGSGIFFPTPRIKLLCGAMTDTNTYEEQVSSLCVSPPPALTLVHFPPISFPYCFRHITCSEILGHVLLQRWDLNCPQLSEEEPGLLSPPAQQHESSMTGRPQEKPPEPGPHLNQLLQKSRERIGGLKQRGVVDSGLEWVGLEQVRPAIKDCSVDWDSGDKRRRWSGNVMEEKPTGIDSRLEVGEVEYSCWSSQLCKPYLSIRTRCEQHLFTTVAFGPSLSPGEDVKPLALHMRGRGQQEHLAAATVTDMSAVE
ncbi:hypothetical protein JEQ12_010363 [Ovis aries]|uniref:Uncharacterized protein n=1 Tax=Ovis aries TaxID=9940 RepID=A0A835ZV12_SHEEP|nr:hypothetical protein JEQ12_010363 [Ovis aries]